MKRNLDSVSQKGKKQRGVAVIFTLGILGLLTVMALGFASTALLNNSLSKNVMNIAYARGLAKNVALTQAIYIISQKEIESNGGFVDFRNVYTWGTDANSANHKDFLWKLDHNDAGVQIYKYEPDKTSDNPANNVRWQYVKDTSSPTPKIIGRYAYVVIPGRGHFDPSVNGAKTLTASPTPTPDELKILETFIGTSVASNNWKNAYGNFRWMTFQELLKIDSSITGNDKTYLFQCKGIAPSITMKSPEAYYEDGKLYSRFNLNQDENWKNIKPEDLCGKDKTLAEFPTKQEFIPWLNKIYSSSDEQKKQALQIAANIIQYNLPETEKTVVDTPEKDGLSAEEKNDWLKNPPNYAGIGRHPMLNEVGFMIRIIASVESHETASSTPENPEYEYEPKYQITIDNGVELINPFGNSVGSSCFVKFSDDLKISLEVRDFKAAAEISDATSDLNELFKSDHLTLASNSAEGLPSGVSGWSVFNFTRELKKTTDWCSSPAYSKAAAFWQGEQTESEQIKTVVFEKFTLKGSDRKGDIEKLMFLYGATLKMGDMVLYCGSSAGNDTQRDIARLSAKTEKVLTYSDGKDVSEDTSASPTQKGWLMLFSCEAKDPLVNHYESDWSDIQTKDIVFLLPTDIRKNYPGTIFKKETGEDDGDKNHKNTEVSGDDPAFTTTSRMETAIIRHDQMRSFWELGCISRGEAWKTLNLMKKNNSSSSDPTYDNGDAALFDQLKFSDNDYTSGKINLNTDVHQVLEKIFDKTLIGFKSGLDNPANDSDNDLLKAGTAASDEVKIQTQTLNSNGAEAHSSSDPCLACLLLDVTNGYTFRNRADLLSAPANLPDSSAAAQTALTSLQDKLFAGATNLEKIQIASKIMPVLRTAPVDTLRVVILAQSIRDIGGDIPVLVDWDGTGIDASISNTAKAMWKAGYRRTIDGAAINGLSEPTLTKTYTTNTIGTYDLGSDKITGETRLVATLVRDPVKRKWKLVRLQYVE